MNFIINPVLEREITVPITFLKGIYQLHKYQIPYFSAVLPMDFVANKFSLIDEIPNTERIEWTLEELFQREISWERVDHGLVKYLKNESIQQFFNALTIALLPRKGHGLAEHYDSNSEKIPRLQEKEFDEPIQIGGIQVQSYSGSNGHAGQLRWDPKEVVALAVDGQHRLAAIKQASLTREQLEKTSVPVIFIIPHKDIGYISPESSSQTVFSSLRKIFIDLNENARIPSRARRILLNDNDIVSVCTRSLIGTKLTESREEERIPLGLVDWVSEKNKFESGQFLTTILILYDIVAKTIDINKLNLEDEDDKKIKEWIEIYFAPFSEDLEELMGQVNRCINQEVPLTFLPEQIKKLGQLFQLRWRPWLFEVFTQLDPYKDLITYAEDQHLLSPEMVGLYIEEYIHEGKRAEERANEIKEAIKANDPDWNKKKNFDEPITYIDESIKNNNWFFKVVFQRAIFNSFLSMQKQRSTFLMDNGKFHESMREFTNFWIKAINAFVKYKFHIIDTKIGGVSDPFWMGIALGAERNIEYTKVGSARIEAWLNAWTIMYYLKDKDEGIPTYKQLVSSDTQLHTMLESVIAKNIKVKSGFEKIIYAKQNDITSDEAHDKVGDAISKRYMGMRKLLTQD